MSSVKSPKGNTSYMSKIGGVLHVESPLMLIQKTAFDNNSLDEIAAFTSKGYSPHINILRTAPKPLLRKDAGDSGRETAHLEHRPFHQYMETPNPVAPDTEKNSRYRPQTKVCYAFSRDRRKS